MPTVDELKYSLSSGGSVLAPHAEHKSVVRRDPRPTLIEHNEAEWESTIEFLERDKRRDARQKLLESQVPDLTGRWNVIHDYARDDDGEGITNCIEGRRGAILRMVSVQCLTI